MKTGIKAGSVEDIALLKDGLSVRTWDGIIRGRTKFDEIRSLTAQSGLVNMVVVQALSFKGGRVLKSGTIDTQLTLHFCSGTSSLLCSENEMDTTVGLDDIAHFSDLQGEGGVFEWLLHLSGAKWTEIAAFARRTAVRELFCELGKFIVGSVNLSLVILEDLNGFGLRTGYFGLGRRSWSTEG